jgi:hypothetical protein
MARIDPPPPPTIPSAGKDEIKDQKAMEDYLMYKKGEQVGCGEKDDSGLIYNNKEAQSLFCSGSEIVMWPCCCDVALLL